MIGTSPRGWGKVSAHAMACAGKRNIPTRVGKRQFSAVSASFCTEHPHAGGEKGGQGTAKGHGHGTSPRGWGKGLEVPLEWRSERNIPTRVGKSWTRSSACENKSEHPHAGGEKCMCWVSWFFLSGTSPRGWGKVLRAVWPDLAIRNIPTRVGKSPIAANIFNQRTEHPHAGGEKPS